MTFLLFQIFSCLLAAALIGALAAWFLRQNLERRREALIQNDWRERMHQAESNRERVVRHLTEEIETLKSTAGGESDLKVMGEYENLISTLEERIAEREGAIGGQRAEIQELRAQLAEAERVAQDRESGLRQQIEALNGELQRRREHESGERDKRATILESSLRERDERLAELTGRLTDVETSAAASEKTLRERHEREVLALRIQLDQLAGDDSTPNSGEARIRQLEEALAQRDDSIAVLRDDIAELTERRTVETRGRQDEPLRAAVAEALAWQEKYEAAAEELARREGRLTELEAALSAEHSRDDGPPAAAPLKEKRGEQATEPSSAPSRSGGERIGSALERPPGPRDNLQKIRGIGPVLEKLLNELGYFHYHQIASFESDDIARVAREIGRFGKRIERDDWVSQARRLHREYHG